MLLDLLLVLGLEVRSRITRGVLPVHSTSRRVSPYFSIQRDLYRGLCVVSSSSSHVDTFSKGFLSAKLFRHHIYRFLLNSP